MANGTKVMRSQASLNATKFLCRVHRGFVMALVRPSLCAVYLAGDLRPWPIIHQLSALTQRNLCACMASRYLLVLTISYLPTRYPRVRSGNNQSDLIHNARCTIREVQINSEILCYDVTSLAVCTKGGGGAAAEQNLGNLANNQPTTSQATH